ncbi:MAG: toprim domain-containing protein, partial [Candidatus Colwellbacteria bacterium]|nr:toprim domain-containing protein [Candidatus Colwellbacteria bacterium]
FGKIVGFSGRVLPEFQTEDSGKYVNSPETPIFNKSRLLYGFWKSKNPIREKKTVLLVEGQMDFLMLWQDGVKNIVATSGTAVTVDHLKNLRKLADTVVLSFDNDAAGILATERAIDMAGSVDFNVNVLTIKDFKDPAEVVEKSPGKISVLIEESTPAMKYYFKRYLDSGENSKKDVRIMLSKVKRLWSPIDKAQWIRELAHKTGWPAKELEEEMEKIEFTENVYKENVPVASSIPTRNAELTRIENITLRLLNLISLKKELLDMAEGHISFLPKKYALIYGAMRDNSGANLDMESREMVQMISLRSSLDSDTIEDEKIHNEFRSLLKELELEYLKEKKMGMARDISLAQNKSLNDESLLQEFKSLINRMKEIQDGKEN